MRVLRFFQVSLFLLLFLVVWSAPLRAQTSSTAAVQGTVTDASGAAVPDAQVALTNLADNSVRTVTTNEQGGYSFPSVVPGNYTLTITKQGFQTSKLPPQPFDTDRSYTVNVPMQVGTLNQQVEVSTAAVQLETTDAQTGNTVENQSLTSLPTLSRDSYELLSLQPGTSNESNITTDTNGGTAGGVAGTLLDQNTTTLDGININSEINSGQSTKYPLSVPLPVEGMSEFRVGISGTNASFGHSTGAQLSMTSATGGNAFHGAAYWFVQNNAFNASTWDNELNGVPKSVDRDNRAGFAVGGPIQKDKTFFYGGMEQRRFFQQYSNTVTVPSDALRAGYITVQDTAYTNAAPISGCTPVNKNGFPVTLTAQNPNSTYVQCAVSMFDPRAPGYVNGINPTITAFYNLYPKTGGPVPLVTSSAYMPGINPSGGDGVNYLGYNANFPEPRKDWDYYLKMDHNFSSNLHFFGRYQYSRIQDAASTPGILQYDVVGDSGGVGSNIGKFVLEGSAATAGLDDVIRTNLINSFRFGYVRVHNDNDMTPSIALANAYALPGTASPLGTVGLYVDATSTALNNTTGLNTPAGIDGQNARTNHNYGSIWEWKDDLNWVKGAHTIAVGVDIQYNRFRSTSASDLSQDSVFPTVGVEGDTTLAWPTCAGATSTLCDIPVGVTGTPEQNWERLFGADLGMLQSTQIYGVRNASLQPTPYGTPQNFSGTQPDYYFYVQDSWKLKSTLTLNYGLGYGWISPFKEVNGEQMQLVNVSNGNAPVDPGPYMATELTDALTGTAYSPTLGYQTVQAGGRNGDWNTDWTDVAPRASIAWNPHNGKTVIRGGYSMLYNRFGGNPIITINGLGFVQAVTLSDATGQLPCNLNTTANGCAAASANPALSVFRIGTDGTAPFGTLSAVNNPNVFQGISASGGSTLNPYFKMGRSHLIDVSIQRQLPGNQILEVGYIGRFGRRLPQGYSLSAVPYMFTDPTSGQTLAQAFDAVANQLRGGILKTAVTAQPWFTNQVPLANLKAANPSFASLCSAAPNSTVCLADISTTNFTNDLINNLVNFSTAPIDAARENAGLAPLTTNTAQTTTSNAEGSNSGGYSNYEGMFVTLRNSGWRGLTYDLNYTRASSKDSGISSQSGVGNITNTFYPSEAYGYSGYDRANTFNAILRYDLPFGKTVFAMSDSGVVGRIVNGWYVSGIVVIESGTPITVINATNQGWGAGSVGSLPTVPVSSIQTGFFPGAAGGNYFANPTAVESEFRPLQLSTDTITGKNDTLRGFPFRNADIRVGKNTTIRESIHLEFTADFFNAFNHHNYADPASLTTSSPANFGAITSTAVPQNRVNSARWIQFGAELRF